MTKGVEEFARVTKVEKRRCITMLQEYHEDLIGKDVPDTNRSPSLGAIEQILVA